MAHVKTAISLDEAHIQRGGELGLSSGYLAASCSRGRSRSTFGGTRTRSFCDGSTRRTPADPGGPDEEDEAALGHGQALHA
jgi:hypothetical protein